MEQFTTETLSKDHAFESAHFNNGYLRISSFEEAKVRFSKISERERLWRGEKYYDEVLKSSRARLGIGEHDRAEAYIFGNGAFPEGDKESHERHFPIPVKVMTIDELYLSPFEVLDLSTTAEEFPWDVGHREIYVHLVVNKLILNAGSKLLVKNNVFVMDCLQAIGNNLNGNQAIIELRGTNTVQRRIQDNDISLNKTIMNGENGRDGDPLKQESTPLGMRWVEGNIENKGHNGINGKKGLNGKRGSNGAMLFLADLRFGQLNDFSNNSIKILASAASGFPGTNGGPGSNGGNGGNGATGAMTTFGIVKGCEGGSGGNGGDGGKGGKGGNGGLCSDIFVSIPQQKTHIFEIRTFAAPSGKGGDGGMGGIGGKKGGNGEYFKEDNNRSLSKDGKDGAKGMSGSHGKTRSAPHVHVYERN
jgi:hypothetical protein